MIYIWGMNNIARFRKLKGWNQTDLADVVGVKQAHISRIEGGADSVTLRLLNQIAEALDVPLYSLFTTDLAQEELKLIQIFRDLPEGRQKAWLEMAHVILAEDQTDDQ